MAGRTIPLEALGDEAIEFFLCEKQRVSGADAAWLQLTAPNRGADARGRAVAEILGGLGRGEVWALAVPLAHGLLASGQGRSGYPGKSQTATATTT